mmetsp:Transcript_51223/g.109696  ORF Transcript_51223/g.109696 Transcript_51223/m.109696 type:complete len:274 (-) Transcript_51223:74-895(-)
MSQSLAKKVVIVGASFIGMEVASSLARKGLDVTVIAMEDVPFERVLGKQIGGSFLPLVEKKRVKFIGGAKVAQIKGSAATKNEPARATGVELGDGSVVNADFVVLGTGVMPETAMVEGVDKLRDRSIPVSASLSCPQAPGLWAVGDIASVEHGEGHRRIEHWCVAMNMGRHAARNIARNSKEPFRDVPFFWTAIFGKQLRYVGHAMEYDDTIIEGDLGKMVFVAAYCKGDEVKAIVTMGRDPVAAAAAELMRSHKFPRKQDLTSGWSSRLLHN